jgi:hypothetical protein
MEWWCDGYTTRPQKARNAERASQGNVARKRYRGAKPRANGGELAPMIGHQKRSPPAKKLACWMACHAGELMPSSCAAGTCQATTTAVPAIQQDRGCVSDRPNERSAPMPRSLLRNARRGAPIRMSGAATVIKRRCWTMWKISS